MIRIPTHRTPTHPGEMLQEEFLTPLRLSHAEVATAIHVSERQIVALVDQRASLTPSIALRLAKLFGMSADFWMNVQVRWDLYQVQQAERAELEAIVPLMHAA